MQIELHAKYDIRRHHDDAQQSWNYDAQRQTIVQMPRRWLLLPRCQHMRMVTMRTSVVICIIIKVIFFLA